MRRRQAALVGELGEALGQQAATAEILRVLSRLPADAQPVYELVAKSAATLCDAVFSGVHLFNGQHITLDAQHNIPPDELRLLQRHVFPLRPGRESAAGRAVHDRVPVHIHDIRRDPSYRLPVLQSSSGFRTVLAVPMLRGGVPIGAISVWRRDVSPYSDEQIRLVETFADRAMQARSRRLDGARNRLDAMLTDQRLAEVAVADGSWEGAHRYLHAAEAHARREGLTWELARVLEARVSTVVRSGQGAESAARRLLEEALGLYERLDDPIEVARLRERLATRPSGSRRGTLPAGLTRREAEVLRLVASGLSNREIAETLSLSEKTVESHLTSVYGRIGADNRAAASAFAVRHGLA